MKNGGHVSLRTEVADQLLPWIARNEPDLTDHGVDHIQNVMANVTQLLGLPREHGGEAGWKTPSDFNIHELVLLLFGCLTHDLGNILGRDKHNQAIERAAKLAGDGWAQIPIGDRHMIERVGRSHSGKADDGGKDTLSELATQSAFFATHQVKPVEVAAVLRFADELAEGPQRTSQALLRLTRDIEFAPNLKLEKASLLFHLYADISQYHIDYPAGRILITYNINISSPNYGVDDTARAATIRELLAMTYARAVKVNAERQYTRHYSSALSRFRETSISLRFNDAGQPIDQLDRNLTISDARTAFEPGLTLERLNPSFAIDDIMEKLQDKRA